MNNINIECNDNALKKLVEILNKLKEVSDRGQRRVIRIGGSERIFQGRNDKITSIVINPAKALDQTSIKIIMEKVDEQDCANKKTVIEVINDFINNDKLFTTYDITTEAKNRGVDKKHAELKDIVHNFFYEGHMPNYSRELIVMSDVSIKPFLYYPSRYKTK